MLVITLVFIILCVYCIFTREDDLLDMAPFLKENSRLGKGLFNLKLESTHRVYTSTNGAFPKLSEIFFLFSECNLTLSQNVSTFALARPYAHTIHKDKLSTFGVILTRKP